MTLWFQPIGFQHCEGGGKFHLIRILLALTWPRKVILGPGFDHKGLFKLSDCVNILFWLFQVLECVWNCNLFFFVVKNNLINFFTLNSRLAYSLGSNLFVFSKFFLIESDHILMIFSCLLFNIYLGLLYKRESTFKAFYEKRISTIMISNISEINENRNDWIVLLDDDDEIASEENEIFLVFVVLMYNISKWVLKVE